MPRSTRFRSARSSERANLYDEITGRIVAELEAGRLPWVQPWGGSTAAPLGLPRNAATGRTYSGINILILWGAIVARGFSGQSWLTFRQALSVGGNVRKGERGTTIVYADRFVPEDERRRAREEGDDAQAIPFLKRFTVFSTDQCDGLPDDIAPTPPPVPEGLILPHVEALIRASGADLRLGGNEAYYSPALDYVQVPRPESFFATIDWHRTALHELGHWTGHESRLARDQSGRFGSGNYAREELVALSGQSAPSATLQ
jgi:antirestriction protein ArdC